MRKFSRFQTALFVTVAMLLLFSALVVSASFYLFDGDKWREMSKIVPRGYVAHYTDTPIVIDGELKDLAWRTAPFTEYFIDIEGPDKTRPKYRTQAKMLWDDEYFYIAAHLQDPHVWGTLTEHDSVIFYDNDFEVFIDPNSDNHEYYEIEINALNTEWDLFLPKPYKDQTKVQNEWEIPGMKKAVHVYGTLNDPKDVDRGWSVEFAFPWEVLGEYAHKPSPPVEGDQWRVNFSRVQWQHELYDVKEKKGKITSGKYRKVKGVRENNWVWSPQGVINMHTPDKWGYVQFTKEKPGTVEFSPDLTEPARNILHGIYRVQRDYIKIHGKYAANVEDLGINFGTHPSIISQPEIELTADGFKAFCTVILPGGITKVVSVRQDSLVEVK